MILSYSDRQITSWYHDNGMKLFGKHVFTFIRLQKDPSVFGGWEGGDGGADGLRRVLPAPATFSASP